MTPILFSSAETAFTSNGLGRLSDAKKCEVTEERNGEYELVLEYPVTGPLIDSLVPGAYIYTTHDNHGDAQAFQIYSVSEPIKGFVTINAWHISYALNNIILQPFTAASCSLAVAAIVPNSINTNAFTFTTDKNVVKDFVLDVPRSVRSVLGGSSGSLLDVYGKGEYEFDMFNVSLKVNRGSNRGVTIRYGKNLSSLERQLDASNVYNAVVPYWISADGSEKVYLDHTVVKTGEIEGKAIALDLSEKFDTAPTTLQLESAAQTYVDTTENYTLKENLKFDFVQLWQTEEYKDVSSLERVSLCDTVTIVYTKRGITASAKCIKVVYDALKERYISMELGEPRTSLTQQISEQIVGSGAVGLPATSIMKSAIAKATELISGGFGGYIKTKKLSDGTPSEILIMDSPTEATATNIIRFNQNGIGFSTDGGATYANAWTIDGNLVASYITTGIIKDALNKNYWNLDTGEFVTLQGMIGSFTIDANGLIGTGPDSEARVRLDSMSISAQNPNLLARVILGMSAYGINGYAYYSDHPGDYNFWVHLKPYREGADYASYIHGLELAPGANINMRMYDRAGGKTYSTLFYGGLYADKFKAGSEIKIDSGGTFTIGGTTINESKLKGISQNLITTPLSAGGHGYYTWGGYNAYLLIGKPSAYASAYVSLLVPNDLVGAGMSWQISDESNYYKFQLYQGVLDGDTGTGTIEYVYGIC